MLSGLESDESEGDLRREDGAHGPAAAEEAVGSASSVSRVWQQALQGPLRAQVVTRRGVFPLVERSVGVPTASEAQALQCLKLCGEKCGIQAAHSRRGRFLLHLEAAPEARELGEVNARGVSSGVSGVSTRFSTCFPQF